MLSRMCFPLVFPRGGPWLNFKKVLKLQYGVRSPQDFVWVPLFCGDRVHVGPPSLCVRLQPSWKGSARRISLPSGAPAAESGPH